MFDLFCVVFYYCHSYCFQTWLGFPLPPPLLFSLSSLLLPSLPLPLFYYSFPFFP